MKKHGSKIFMTMLLMMICLSNLTAIRSQTINVDRDKLKTALAKADLADSYEAEMQRLLVVSFNQKQTIEKITKERDTAQNQVETLTKERDKLRWILGGIILVFVALFIIWIRR